MPKGSFVRLNDEADAEGRDPFANPRNAAAGSLRKKDPKVTARRDLATFIYAIADTDPLHVHSQREFLDWLRSAGFSVNPNVARCATPTEVHEFCAQALEHRGDLDYDIDGVVVKVDSFQPVSYTHLILPWRPSHNGVARVFCDVCTPDCKRCV